MDSGKGRIVSQGILSLPFDDIEKSIFCDALGSVVSCSVPEEVKLGPDNKRAIAKKRALAAVYLHAIITSYSIIRAFYGQIRKRSENAFSAGSLTA